MTRYARLRFCLRDDICYAEKRGQSYAAGELCLWRYATRAARWRVIVTDTLFTLMLILRDMIAAWRLC